MPPDSLDDLTLQLRRFAAERDWETFHSPKNLAMALTGEAGELAAEFQWLTEAESLALDAPRKARGVQNVLDGTVFSITLLSGTSTMDSEVSQAVVNLLGQCGIHVIHQALSPAELYAPGPEGPLFGRNFDLALVSWQPTPGNACELYRSNAIPDSGNYWIGTNLAGLSDIEFNAKCTAAGNAELLPSPGDGVDLVAEYLPAVPLMPRISLWAASARVDLGGAETFGELELWRPAVLD